MTDNIDKTSEKNTGAGSRQVLYMYSRELVEKCDGMQKVPQRASMVHSLIEAYGLLRYLKIGEPRHATTAEVLGFHSTDYVEFLQKIDNIDDEEKFEEEAAQFGLSYDCPVHEGLYRYATLYAGTTIQAAESLVNDECDVAINWYGGWHHAHKDTASGFCYINDIVLGILKLREKYEKVLYVDLDLHHGDGVEEAFSATSKVMTLSVHKYAPGFFPGTTMGFLLSNKGAHLYNGNIHTCGKCKKNYKTLKGLQNHICTLCELCGKVFSSKQRFSTHLCQAESKFVCKNCQKTYQNQQRLKNHNCPYCQYCQKVFSTYQNFSRHVNTVHQCASGKSARQDLTNTLNKTSTPNIKSVPPTSVTNVNTSRSYEPASTKNIEESTKCNKVFQPTSTTNIQSVPPISATHIKLVSPTLVTNVNMSDSTIRSSQSVSAASNCNAAVAEDCRVTCAEQIRYHFSPVNFEWQLNHCMQLNTTLVKPHHFKSQSGHMGRPSGIVPIIGDGNCFFRAISYILCGSEEYHLNIRQKVTSHMTRNSAVMAPVLPENVTFQQYMNQSQMVNPRVWATEVEIFATAHLLKTDIYIFGDFGLSTKWQKHSATFLQSDAVVSDGAIYLKHTGGNHYEVVTSTLMVLPDTGIDTKSVDRKGQADVMKTAKDNQKRVRNLDQERLHKKKMRESPIYRNRESQNKKRTVNKDAELKRKKMQRESLEYSTREMQNKRRTVNKDAERKHKKMKRECEEYRTRESQNKRRTVDKGVERKRKKMKRESVEYRTRELQNKRRTRNNDADRKHKKLKRECEEYRTQESRNKKRTVDEDVERKRKKMKRESEEYRTREIQNKRRTRNKDADRKHKKMKRESVEYRTRELLNKRQTIDVDGLIASFHKIVTVGPQYVCTCCNQLWYRHSVRCANDNISSNVTLQKRCVTGVVSFRGKEWLCNTCFTSLKSGKLPALAKANDMEFPLKPDVLKLTNLEERLVAPRIPFMQLHELPRGGQISLHGNVVNVPTNVNLTVNVLPRKQDDAAVIPLKLKRKLSYEHHYQYQTVRPNKVINAVNWLAENSELYRKEGIQVDKQWTYQEDDTNIQGTDASTDNEENKSDRNSVVNNDVKNGDHIETSEDNAEQSANSKQDSNVGLSANCDKQDRNVGQKNIVLEVDEWEETTGENISTANMDTMMQNIIEESREIVSLAPGEGSKPMSIFLDKHAEELSFPTIYCGQERKDNKDREVSVSYSDLCKSELRRKDRRVASHLPNLFFKTKKLQLKHILDKANLCLRKTKGKQSVTAGDLKCQENVDKLVHRDEGFRIFKELRGSPPYWEKVKRDIFALIRQLGLPTWFASFSSAETKWEHLLRILGETVDNRTYTDEEIANFTWQKIQHLIQNDPVTCVRHFDFQVQTFLHAVLQSSLNPIGPVEDTFHKVEFQMRGSPHIHMLIWVKNSPQLDKDKIEDIISFIDKYVTCGKTADIEDLINRQVHAHSRSCKKKNKLECRFGFPAPPLQETQILDPLPDDTSEMEKKKYEDIYKRIQTTLNDKNFNHTMTHNEFLQHLNILEDDYIKAIQASIRTKTVFIKRDISEVRINNYNNTLLKCWRANMDLQYVLDPYACAMYIVSYIAKSQRGMSNLLYNACEEAKKGNLDLKRQVHMIGHKFLTHVEISAQEAVYLTLQIPLYKASRDVIFINTAPPEERTTMIKSFQVIQNLPDDSTDIHAESIQEQYSNRPKQLENVCLADYVSWYRRVRTTKCTNTQSERNDDFQEDVSDDDDDKTDDNMLNKTFQLDNGYILKKRQKQAVIRYVRYSFEKDKENHCREILLLFLPWRDESQLMDRFSTYQDRYQELSEKNSDLETKMGEYNHASSAIEKAMEDIEKLQEENLEDQWDKVAPNAQDIEHQDEEIGAKPSDKFPAFLPPDESQFEYSEIAQDLGIVSECDKSDIIVKMMKDNDYLGLVRSLNNNQRQFFYHVMNCVKTNLMPFYIFLTGGAGVGKTAVVTAVFQMLIRLLNKGEGKNPDELKVLLGAPTGKAAFLIGGCTLHSLFHIPASQGFSYKPLTCEKTNTLRCKFRSVSVLIIDEISMVGNQMLGFIHQRLQQIMGSPLPFGGLSVIAVGDLYQLKPVFDGWIFEDLREDYGPLSVNLWQEYFSVFHLTEIMRQKEDKDYASLLNRLRTGKQQSEDISLLKTRTIDGNIFDIKYPFYVPHIFLQNRCVDAHNNQVFLRSPTSDQISITAWDTVVGDVTPDVSNKIKQSIPNDCSKTMGLAKTLQTAIGLQAELSTNIDVEDGLANGASCIIKSVQVDNRTMKPLYIWVRFDHDNIGSNLRKNSKHLYKSGVQALWTPISQVKRQFKVGRYKMGEVLRCQFPIRPSSGKTAHRCQGDTMESAVINFTGRSFPHVHYVALSRVKSLDKLYIIDFKESSISVSQKVSQEMERLENNRQLELSLSVEPLNTGEFKCIFLNVRSLKKHLEDIKQDPFYRAADLLMFVETKLSNSDPKDQFQIPGYSFYPFNVKTPKNRSVYGTALYSKKPLPDDSVQNSQPSNGIEFSIIHLPDIQLAVVSVYVSPSIPFAKVKPILKDIDARVSELETNRTIIFGDFNIDLKKSKKHDILTIFGKYQQKISPPTTEYGSLIDHIYSNIPNSSSSYGVYDSYFSDHKPVWSVIC